MQRWVLHVDMDAFYASVEQMTRPTLRGRPVLVGGVSGRGVVAGASYQARAFGAHSAIPMHQARKLVGFGAVVVSPRGKVYSAASRRVFEVIRRQAGVIEQLSIDEAFMEPLELVGATSEEVLSWAENLRAEVKSETGLPCSIGAGSGKQYAKIGSGEAKPDGVYVIPVERQREMLDPLPVRKLWGIGPVAEAKLRQLGVNTIADFAAMTEAEVRISLGGTVGVALWHLARGHDDRPVMPRAVAKQISTEHTYPKDLTTVAEVDDAIDRAASGAYNRLLADGRGARTVTVKLKMADFRTESRSQSLPYTTDEKATLVAVAHNLARYPDEVGPIRLVGVSFSGLEHARQNILFPELDQKITVPRADADYEVGVRGTDHQTPVITVTEPAPESRWKATQDVRHPEYGHGWVQGAGHGIVSVRFETRTTGPGKTRTFDEDDSALEAADPLDSLDWGDWFADQRYSTG
ncbi:DNA polymerase IV [Corynebacterium sp. CCM 9204]|uniref:DNA polymerase IV n=1 Tax=Corynebacterium sp. CCM 9204 TaxID=3057616 RepID=UPI0035254678